MGAAAGSAAARPEDPCRGVGFGRRTGDREEETAPLDPAAVIVGRRDEGNAYLELPNVASLSGGLHVLPAGVTDGRRHHAEDAVASVASGRATPRIGDEGHPVAPGPIAFDAYVVHRFRGIVEEPTLLVFFAPERGRG